MFGPRLLVELWQEDVGWDDCGQVFAGAGATVDLLEVEAGGARLDELLRIELGADRVLGELEGR